MGEKQLGFVFSHSGHSQGSKGRLPLAHGKDNITTRIGWSSKGCTRRKDIGSHVPPTTNTPKKG
jgi:hypothetical protein